MDRAPSDPARRVRGSVATASWTRAGTALLVTLALILTIGAGPGFPIPSRSAAPSEGAAASDSGRSPVPVPSPPSNIGSSPLSVNDSVSTSTVCAFGVATCPGIPGAVQVRLAVAAPSLPTGNQSRVEVLYLLDVSQMTTDENLCPSFGSCVPGGTGAVQMFTASAGTIAATLQRAHPAMNLSFAMAVTEGTTGAFDDDDSPVFAVPVGDFTNATEFGNAVNRSWTLPGDIDVADNALQSGVIAAMYGAFTGQFGDTPNFAYSQVNWTPNSRHVVVWIGATAPQDPNYLEDYCPITGDSSFCASNDSTGGLEPTCEPSFNFSAGPSPRCEGWVASQDANPLDSIAALSRGGAACLNSSLGRCTVDSIILNATSTNPGSPDWAPSNRSGDNASDVQQNTAHVVAAGCDLATLSGGSWDGPQNSTCGNVSGTLPYIPTTHNTPLLDALANVSVGGTGVGGIVASPAGPAPMFQFVTTPTFAAATTLNASAQCSSPGGPLAECPQSPSVTVVNGSTILTWNWSSAGSPGAMGTGDVWSAVFDLAAVGGPSNGSLLDECSSPECVEAPNGSAPPATSGVTYVPWGLSGVLLQSFGPLWVSVAPTSVLVAALVPFDSVVEAPANVSLQLVAAGGHPPYFVTWTFGDGTTETTPSLFENHTYLGGGSFPLAVGLRDSSGTLRNFTQTITVVPPLVATASPLVVNGTAPFPVWFHADPGGGEAPYEVVWTFAGGDSDTGTLVEFTFSTPGNFTVGLEVTDAFGRTVNATVTVNVSPATPSTPLAVTGSASELSESSCGTGNLSARFVGVADGGVAPYSYAWTFAGGQVEYGTPVTARFVGNESRIATLSVTDSDGSTAHVEVGPPSEIPALDQTCATPSSGLFSPVVLVLLAVVVVGSFGAVVLLVRSRGR
ncbi:MAG: hypothetical protein L3K16_00325 [Thermoplasmata archaeon]|nr:hypothetical protein [Thermoplasmata archaeon]